MLKKIIIGLAVVVAGVIAAAFAKSPDFRVERSLEIAAPAEKIFPYFDNHKKFNEWNPWSKMDPGARNTYSGPESGVGAVYSWTGKSSGNGTLKITAAQPASSISYSLDFENGKHLSTGALAIEPQGDGVVVRWHNAGELGANPVNRIFGLLMDRMMGPDFEEGLRKLKQRVENKTGAS